MPDKIQILNLQDKINSTKETRQCNNMMNKDISQIIKMMFMEIQSKEMNGIIFKVK
jgi:hypothetical protein